MLWTPRKFNPDNKNKIINFESEKMTSKIHPTSIIGKNVKIDQNVQIGPWCIIEDNVHIGKDVNILERVHIGSGTTIGESCYIHMGSVLGHIPQDRQYKEEKTFLKIGSRNIFREYTNVHRATGEGKSTIIGNDNFFMVGVHIAHNCLIGSGNTICNNTALGGYAEVENDAFISGQCGIHQFSRIGRLAMIGPVSKVAQDIPPYMLVGTGEKIASFNIVGLRRAGFGEEKIRQVKESYKILYRSGLNIPNALAKIEEKFDSEEIKHLVDFIKNSKRGIASHI